MTTRMLPIARRLQPKAQRIRMVQEEMAALQAQLRQAAGVAVVRVARCGHPECGPAAPSSLPEQALVIELGCSHQIPHVEPPAVEETRSRAERPSLGDAVGRGLPEHQHRQTLKLLTLLR